MADLPLEISKEDYERFSGKLEIVDFLGLLNQRGANLTQEKIHYL